MADLGACSLDELRARSSEKWTTHPADVLPAFIAEMDFDVAEPIRRAVVGAVERSDIGYPYPVGLGPAFAGFARQWWGWGVDPARVHAAADVMTGVATMLALCTPSGSGVVINPPVYPPFFFRLEQSARRVVPVPLFGSDLDVDAVDAALAAPDVGAYLLCSPHNPLGRVWTRDELLAVAEVCWRRQVLLLVDEIHSPLVMTGAEFVPFLSLDHPMVERSVVFHSASKGWNVPGLKCGLIVTGSAALSDLVQARWEALFPSQLGVVGTEAAYAEPEAHQWLQAVVAQLEENRASLEALLAAAAPEITFTRPQASFLVWLDCRSLGLGDDPATHFLAHGKVALSPGRAFGEPGRGHARLNMGTSPAILAEIVGRIGTAVAAG